MLACQQIGSIDCAVMLVCQCGDDMTIKQWRYDDEADEATECLLNTIIGKVTLRA